MEGRFSFFGSLQVLIVPIQHMRIRQCYKCAFCVIMFCQGGHQDTLVLYSIVCQGGHRDTLLLYDSVLSRWTPIYTVVV